VRIIFRIAPDDRGVAREILEGVLLAAQKERQEKKVTLYGNLYANIAFDPVLFQYSSGRTPFS
jgi:hypothetical protein